MLSKVLLNEVVMHYFEKMSSAFGGSTLRPPPWLCHLSGRGTYILQTPSLPTPGKKSCFRLCEQRVPGHRTSHKKCTTIGHGPTATISWDDYLMTAAPTRALRAQTSAKAVSDDFLNLTDNFFSKDTSLVQFLSISDRTFFQRYESNCRKMPYRTMIKNPLKNSDSDADIFQNLLLNLLFLNACLVKCS